MRIPDAQRCRDLCAAIVLSALAAPVVGILGLLVRRRVGSPALFWQERAGRNGVPFRLVKLRTMTDDVDPDGELLPDERRLTPFGRWLRSTSLDELPELWNVLRGDMALVGPRPLPVRYVARYTDAQRRRLLVRPGITGWAQVNGRNTSSWKDRLAMDEWYVDNRSWSLDLRILARTLGPVLRRGGVTAIGHATMPEFDPDGRP